MIKKIRLFIYNHPVKSIICYAILIRLAIVLIYQAITIYPDSQNYINLSNYLSHFSLENYTGERTPGFPLLIAVANNNLIITILFQLMIGVLSTYLIYDFSRLKTKNITLAFWIAIIYTSFLHVIFFEFAILTEALSVFLVILTFWYIQKFKLLEAKSPIKNYVVLSIIFSWMYLTKPMLIYLPVGFTLFYLIKQLKSISFLKGFIVLIIPFITYFSWNSLNKKNIGYFTNTYYFGINLSQTATSFFDKAPDNDKLIRDIFVKHRDSILKHDPKKYPMSVWFAYDELLKKTKLSPQDLSYKLGDISKRLIMEYPQLYLKQIFISWIDFWKPTNIYWNPEKITNPYIKGFIVWAWLYFMRYLLFIFNIIFLVLGLIHLLFFIRDDLKQLNMDFLIICTILCGSLLQAMVAYGSNSRFSFPFFALIVYFVISKLSNVKKIFLLN
ncbi:dolichyl-phosphate-mannose--protein mannosyltransferase [Yeosuana aromativorans]|uniref:Dolichyl-phosphate-mannose--protein mannosyltransferase n=1 Tax=Yeosuana aromativorans TaxID=288019 RepID=A0A8J3FIJ5_9FLAO|nr:glycosyltransferase family 39 protein [Yeosuana aromativorans]GGK25545.1 dolichyl-phosphate-mannose--protein mannosyltransferase [Yeosuana aromativorans]